MFSVSSYGYGIWGKTIKPIEHPIALVNLDPPIQPKQTPHDPGDLDASLDSNSVPTEPDYFR